MSMPLGIQRLSRRDRGLGQRAHRGLEPVAQRDRVHGADVVLHAAPLGDTSSAWLGSITVNRGRMVPKYGAFWANASENSRSPTSGMAVDFL